MGKCFSTTSLTISKIHPFPFPQVPNIKLKCEFCKFQSKDHRDKMTKINNVIISIISDQNNTNDNNNNCNNHHFYENFNSYVNHFFDTFIYHGATSKNTFPSWPLNYNLIYNRTLNDADDILCGMCQNEWNVTIKDRPRYFDLIDFVVPHRSHFLQMYQSFCHFYPQLGNLLKHYQQTPYKFRNFLINYDHLACNQNTFSFLSERRKMKIRCNHNDIININVTATKQKNTQTKEKSTNNTQNHNKNKIKAKDKNSDDALNTDVIICNNNNDDNNKIEIAIKKKFMKHDFDVLMDIQNEIKKIFTQLSTPSLYNEQFRSLYRSTFELYNFSNLYYHFLINGIFDFIYLTPEFELKRHLINVFKKYHHVRHSSISELLNSTIPINPIILIIESYIDVIFKYI
jgi:hypothetical protein